MGWIFGNKERHLTAGESNLVKHVFNLDHLPPLSKIRIRDGLALSGVPFTTLGPSRLKLIAAYPFTTSGEYLLMVGPALFDRDLSYRDPATLLHEMTHVWQYRQKTLTELRGLATHAFYYFSGKLGGKSQGSLYSYDVGPSWNEMGFEGQAQLVQDWYSIDCMSERCERWYYVKNVLLKNEPRSRYSRLEDLR